MPIHDANRNKLEFLLAQGTHEGELRKFFVESRAQLIMKGARVQNLPRNRDERIRVICEKLPHKTNDTLQNWFQNNILVSQPLPLDDVLVYLEIYFDGNDQPLDDEIKLVARSALMYLFKEDPDQKLLSVIQRAPGNLLNTESYKSVTEDIVDTTHNEIQDEVEPPFNGYQLPELLSSIIADDEDAIDNALTPFPQNTRILVEALLCVRDGNIDTAKDQLELLDPESSESTLVESAINRARYKRSTHSSTSGIRLATPKQLMEDPDTDSYDIIGVCTKELETGPVFVKPLAIMVSEELYLLNQEDRDRLFPESGSVMSFRSEFVQAPNWRDIVRWKVAEKDGTEGRTRYHMLSELPSPIEVLKISVPSTDPDEVRERIKDMFASSPITTTQQKIFLLSDNVAVAAPKFADLTSDKTYDQPWQAWSSLDTWLIEGHQYCLNITPDSASNLDLSPLDTAFKRLIKNLEDEKKFTISRAQKRELADLLRNYSNDKVELRAKRISSFLDQVVLAGEELDKVLQLLNSREDINQRVEQLVTEEFEKQKAERSGLQIQINDLKRSKSKLEKECNSLERKNNKLASSAASSVKKAFSKAIDEGITTLTNAEIFRNIIGNNTNGPSINSVSPANRAVEPWIEHQALTPLEVKEHMIALGLNGRQAIAITQLSALAMHSGVGLIFKGPKARQLVKILARLDCNMCGMIEIPMGLSSSAFIQHALDKMNNVERIVILDADLSPIEVYGTHLLDSLFEAAITSKENHKPILFSCLDGDMSIPLPYFIQQIAIIVDLDTSWDDERHTLEEIETDSIPLLKPFKSRILDQISTLEKTTRTQVERVLIKAITSK